MPHRTLNGILISVVLSAQATAFTLKMQIHDAPLHQIDDRIFGQFMERPTWGGEMGVEGCLIPGTNRLQPEVVEHLRGMRIPLMRFPGGSSVGYGLHHDWTVLISNSPSRNTPERPVVHMKEGSDPGTNAFGLDEFIALCRDIKTDPLLCVHFHEAFDRSRPLKEAALHAAGLVAYCNAPQGAGLPAGMPDWPAARAKNNHPEPYGVKYFQIGNETWFSMDEMIRKGDKEAGKYYVECLAEFVKQMRAVDPSIEIIADGMPDSLVPMIEDKLGDKIQYLAYHSYRPWGINRENVLRNGLAFAPEKISKEEGWYAWAATPGFDRETGQAVEHHALYGLARRHGYKIAVTEWNWNGWWDCEDPPIDSLLAKGIGAAGWLHAFMREGDVVSIACQSMVAGNAWGITAIRADREAKYPAYMLPTGQVTKLYSSHHGKYMVPLHVTGKPYCYEQPYRMAGIQSHQRVAYVDALATADDDRIYIHAINRHYREEVRIDVDLSHFRRLKGKAVMFALEGDPERNDGDGVHTQAARIRDHALRVRGNRLVASLPRRSVSVIVLEKAAEAEKPSR